MTSRGSSGSGIHFRFDSAICPISLSWGAQGLAGIRLADTGEAALQELPDPAASPPSNIDILVEALQAWLDGKPVPRPFIPLDLSTIRRFERQVFALTLQIPWGGTQTYGDIAGRLGSLSLARAVGQALGRNPWPLLVPCHRVVATDGGWGGFSAPGGSSTKKRLLEIEGAFGPASLPLFGGSRCIM